jgi:isocitrate/isopropylmalate dehydrogenase
MSKHRIAVVPGDGIGKETMPEGIRVMEAAATKFGIDLAFDHFDFSSWDYYEKHGQMMTRSTSAPSAGPRRSLTTSRCGVPCCSSGASSTST